MEIFAISGLINGIVATAFGVLVILKNWKDRSNQLYFLMTAALALWSFSYWQWLLSSDYTTALFWVRTLSVGSLFIPIFFFHWVIQLTKNRTYNCVVLKIVYAIAVIIIFFVNSPLFIANLEGKSIFTFWPNAGMVYDIYFSYIYVGLILYTIYILIRSYRLAADNDRKGQILYILIGAILGFGGGLTNFPLWFGIPLPPYGNFLVAAFPFLLGYSVLKFKLFDAKTIATELLVFFIEIILLVQAVLSKSATEAVLKGGLFIVVGIFGYLLIKSVYREVEQRQQIEQLAAKLEASNEALEGVNKNLAVANEKLKELDQLKSEFVSLATHQIRGPLTAIKGYASLIMEGDYGRISAKVKEALDYIYKSTESLVLVVSDFLDVSRIEQGRMKYDFKIFDFRDLVKEIVNELKPNIDKAGLNFTFESKEEEKFPINGDQVKLKQVIANIIDNSVKYTPKGSVKVSVTKHGKKIKFAVKDTGVGISPDTLPRLFAKFSRAQDASLTNTSGTGLGLYLAKAIIEAHQGKIWAESEGKGKGSQFYVELDETKKI
ncbi:MAG: ATP-binding protein [Candidatus Paceibacterota bacterium]|jgi:signal transduction histidine kinase